MEDSILVVSLLLAIATVVAFRITVIAKNRPNLASLWLLIGTATLLAGIFTPSWLPPLIKWLATL